MSHFKRVPWSPKAVKDVLMLGLAGIVLSGVGLAQVYHSIAWWSASAALPVFSVSLMAGRKLGASLGVIYTCLAVVSIVYGWITQGCEWSVYTLGSVYCGAALLCRVWITALHQVQLSHVSE